MRKEGRWSGGRLKAEVLKLQISLYLAYGSITRSSKSDSLFFHLVLCSFRVQIFNFNNVTSTKWMTISGTSMAIMVILKIVANNL